MSKSGQFCTLAMFLPHLMRTHTHLLDFKYGNVFGKKSSYPEKFKI